MKKVRDGVVAAVSAAKFLGCLRLSRVALRLGHRSFPCARLLLRFETQSLPSLLRSYPRSFTFYLGSPLSSIRFRLRRVRLPGKSPLSRFETQSLPSLLRCYPRSFTFYLGNPFSSIRFRLRCGLLPRASLLSRFRGSWLCFRRRSSLLLSPRLPLLARFFIAQVSPEFLVGYSATETGSSDCDRSRNFHGPLSRCQMPRTFR